jgi:predicted  nucleic acid-binding Zn-ribbon protein
VKIVTLEEIRIRKVDLQNTINEFQRKAKPLEDELKELTKLESKLEKEQENNN